MKRVAARQVHALSLLANSQNATDLHNLLVYSWLALAIMAVLSVALGWLIAGRLVRSVGSPSRSSGLRPSARATERARGSGCRSSRRSSAPTKAP